MKASSANDVEEPKGHICPPSNATHPMHRWESLFVYGFICRFTQLRSKVEGLDSPMDFEAALTNEEVDPVMVQILSRFVLNLRPQTRNLSSDVISSTISALMQEHLRGGERGVFWDDGRKMNVDPLSGLEKGFWSATWDLKLRILRQLVELQLSFSPVIKRMLDRAYGVVHNKHKKAETTESRPPPDDPFSQENLQLIALGQDIHRKRYWITDDSPRVYSSTNPWKITSTFQALSSTRDEYLALIDKLKESSPSQAKAGERKSKIETNHLLLLQVLEDRIPAIDAEIARIQRAQKKIAQRNILIAQAELRETRTRRQTTRPDYAYLNDPTVEDEPDEYRPQEDEDEDDQFEDDGFSTPRDDASTSDRHRAGTRRSTRTTTMNGTNNKSSNEWPEWRGERRSTRLGAPAETQLDPLAPKRARTEDSVTSSLDGSGSTTGGSIKVKFNGAAAIKPTETVVESVAGKKKSKFWVYAVEPVVPAQQAAVEMDFLMSDSTGMGNDHQNGIGSSSTDGASSMEMQTGGESYATSVQDSPSPSPSMDES
ncbi:hypothetical protein PHLGIDRAFT_30978 [Phlebiopsis gigantea 11061_1 CR5-6]|uniref:WHIM1 domain-containing protein n=1 Tax=Phlebiopsis gigantea (strain 11061_1 CR5-6) TaxID=745531 RepID=A0A0C3PHJ3_PHLG1|nr:hypothetical protein PHLGIDRAFT_30978 [Phlebiopsis gigantea 11061_1 CR5-6]